MAKSIKMDCRVNIMLRTWGLVARLPFLSVWQRERDEQFIIQRPQWPRERTCVFDGERREQERGGERREEERGESRREERGGERRREERAGERREERAGERREERAGERRREERAGESRREEEGGERREQASRAEVIQPGAWRTRRTLTSLITAHLKIMTESTESVTIIVSDGS